MDQQHNVVFHLDARERQLIETFKDVPNIVVSTLDLGDFQVRYGDSIRIIVERKTVSDLAASIKDNRYREQKARVLAARDADQRLQYFYIIEGTFSFEPSFKHKHMPGNVLAGSIINSMIRDNIFVFFTKNLSETAELLNGIMTRIVKEPSKYYSTVGHQALQSYQDVAAVQPRKKDNTDNESCLLQQICAVPGISTKKARAIIEHFDSPMCIGSLCEKLKDAGGSNELVKVDGIGKKLAQQITLYLLGPPAP